MTDKIVIFGTGSFAQVLHAHLGEDSRYEVAAFTVTSDRMMSPSFSGCPVVPFESLAKTHSPDDFKLFIAVGYTQMNRQRRRFYNEAKIQGYELLTYIAPTVSRQSAKIGDNCCILDGSIVEPFATIGANVVVWGGSHIGHHSTIGAHSFLAPRVAIAGHVTIGDHCFLGINSTIRDGITVADNCLIGAGVTVLHNTTPGAVYIASRPKRYTGDTARFFQ